MIKHEINSVLNEYTLDELKENQQDLLKKAQHICSDAYAPYSMFKVGASLILKMVKSLMEVIKKMLPILLDYVLKE